jgi:hypothetical protein
MLWHVVTLDLAHLDASAREQLEAKLAELEKIDEVRWFRLRRDVERPANTTFVSVFVNRDALARYRVDPIHLSVADAIRQSNSTVTRLDLVDLPLPP